MENSSFNWDDNPDLNITPLVDIMLVLLAILMVTVPTINYKEDITLAKGSKTQKVLDESIIEIRIDKKKNIYIKDSIYSYTNFTDNFNLFANKYDKDTEVRIRADEGIVYGDVIFVLKTIKEAGFLKASLITNG
ncbi:biopolymer transporter ExbD [Helicobacter sp. MIT 99-5507]|uniref:biopolymer transporter ExbD n=1 Tax=Helicobacter sp. MIT 99-5507 TaxID=152489 RepID=UPI000E1E4FCB|nr:biopolymer transporter ExbD [Helicobacter sp. MIT 99-5507]RDU58385.1 biopolymer transporter ExbD [Helicobacter sp. MIT 99-5507]